MKLVKKRLHPRVIHKDLMYFRNNSYLPEGDPRGAFEGVLVLGKGSFLYKIVDRPGTRTFL